ncbi:LOW QUALITY PROTEIN: phosphatidylinositol N-acetylglucosaminyltransferase subunit C-like [Saccostrea echinata]|uniref:LOW QUALITY PROTEIN: phosphatidylinositol N-acetylglucosaminyltransferase subunit C-like n=1 Tax=Saccostrea echinata TaxID=191078 RepID=UPI002A7ED272|nr:LOW QUALITY PROTEIN: phosphatidylinositol N-acetylglucosaminyltransferase subunit C-like [Saccostrea echinata]
MEDTILLSTMTVMSFPRYSLLERSRDIPHVPHTGKMAAHRKTKWRKILYEHQNVPDNYTDDSFLDAMRKNLYIRKYEYWSVVRASGEITQQISSMCLFIVSFIYMDDRRLSPDSLVVITIAASVIGYIVSKLVDKVTKSNPTEDEPQRTVLEDLKTFVMFMGFSFCLSPVLVSLTETISTDTIYAMTTMMLLANLAFHNYGVQAALVSEAFSLNAAIFASVCLASRLHSSLHAFATVTFSLLIFGLWPRLRHKVKKALPVLNVILTVVLGTVALLALFTISMVTAVMFILGHMFITFICPAWLISLQPLKNNIHGPWDEAVIKND